MNVAVIEDEIPARKHLISLLRRIQPDVHVAFEAQSIKEAIAEFQKEPTLDLVFMDIQLNDGLSLEIFEHVSFTTPVIFVTAFDQYIMDAFQLNGIEYLLKPLKQADLALAISKYRALKDHFTVKVERLRQSLETTKSTRILIRKGTHFSSVSIWDVAYFFSDHKVVFMMNWEGARFIVEENLSELEQSCGTDFFRLNRQCLSSRDAIDAFKGDGKGRLTVKLKPPFTEELVISQEKAGPFKEWLVG